VRGFPWASDGPLGGIESDMANVESSAMGEHFEHAKGALGELKQYASEVKTETKRVTWPSMQEVYGTTIMVVLTTFLFGIYFWACDEVFQYIVVRRILGYFMHRG
jgi:preprotein translocase SecE subunit